MVSCDKLWNFRRRGMRREYPLFSTRALTLIPICTDKTSCQIVLQSQPQSHKQIRGPRNRKGAERQVTREPALVSIEAGPPKGWAQAHPGTVDVVIRRIDEEVDRAHGHQHETISRLAVVRHHRAGGEVEGVCLEHELGPTRAETQPRSQPVVGACAQSRVAVASCPTIACGRARKPGSVDQGVTWGHDRHIAFMNPSVQRYLGRESRPHTPVDVRHEGYLHPTGISGTVAPLARSNETAAIGKPKKTRGASRENAGGDAAAAAAIRAGRIPTVCRTGGAPRSERARGGGGRGAHLAEEVVVQRLGERQAVLLGQLLVRQGVLALPAPARGGEGDVFAPKNRAPIETNFNEAESGCRATGALHRAV